MNNPLSWDYMTAPLREMPTFGPFSLAFFVLFVMTFLFSAFLYLTSGSRFATNHVLKGAIRTGTQIMMWLTAIGLFFFSWRLMRIDFGTLYMRFWSYLFLLLYVGVVGYFIYWMRTTYRERIATIERNRVGREYSPQGRPVRRVKRKAKRGVR
ncbi:MAG: hypothetical protein R3A46_20070 [Thermomicrobiales bacterium]